MAPSEIPAATADSALPSRLIRIVIVEDHLFVREGTRRLLEMEPDMEVVGEASTGREAVQLAHDLHPGLMIMDISLPEMDGIEATRRIREADPRMPVLILTAYDDDQYVFALLEAGAAGYLLKDVDRTQLVNAIRAVARGEAVLHPSIATKLLQRYRNEGAGSEGNGSPLSPRELEVLRATARGLGNDAIALELNVSVRTVQAHMSHIFDKTDTGSRTQAVIEALRRRWIRLEELEP